MIQCNWLLTNCCKRKCTGRNTYRAHLQIMEYHKIVQNQPRQITPTANAIHETKQSPQHTWKVETWRKSGCHSHSCALGCDHHQTCTPPQLPCPSTVKTMSCQKVMNNSHLPCTPLFILLLKFFSFRWKERQINWTSEQGEHYKAWCQTTFFQASSTLPTLDASCGRTAFPTSMSCHHRESQ